MIIKTYKSLEEIIFHDEVITREFKKRKAQDDKYWKSLGFMNRNEYIQIIEPNTKTMLQNAGLIEKKLLNYIAQGKEISEEHLDSYGFPKMVYVEVLNSFLRDKLIKKTENRFIISPLARSIIRDYIIF